MLKFNLRLMQKKDIEILYNHLHLRHIKKYFGNDMMQWKIHKKWYESILKSPNYIYYIVEDTENDFIGFVSFEIKKKNAKIGIFIAEKFREKKYSQKILETALIQIKENKKNIRRVIAYILPENFISKKLFLSLNFEFYKKKTVYKIKYYLFTKNV